MESIREKQGLLPHERFNSDCTERLCCSEEWDGICPCMANGISSSGKTEEVVIEPENSAQNEMDFDKIEQEVLDYQLERLESKVGPIEESKKHIVTLEDVKNCDDCDEDEWNF